MTYGTDQLSGINLATAYTIAPATSRGFGTDVIPFALGQSITASDESVWLFCLIGDGGLTGASYVCWIDEDFTATMLPAGRGGGKVGVANSAADEGDYAWLQVFGPASIQVAADAADGVELYTTTEPGVLDDDDASGFPTGIVLTTANGGEQAAAPGWLNWNVLGDAPALAIAGNDTLSLTVDEAMTPEVYTATGGVPPYTFTVSVGTLPDGLTLDPDGTLSGTPTVEDVTDVTIQVEDASTATDTLPVEITVGAAATPLVVSNFKTGVYSIGGVVGAIGDVWEQNTDWGTWNPASVIPGTGVVVTALGADAQASPVLTATAMAGLLPSDGGYTVVVAYRLAYTSVAMTGNARMTLDVLDLPDFNAGWGYVGALNGNSTEVASLTDYGALDVPLPGVDYSGAQLVKVAFTYTPTAVAGSLNGGTVVTGGAPMANLGANAIAMLAQVVASGDPANTGTVTVEYVAYYTPVDNSVLPTLSTP